MKIYKRFILFPNCSLWYFGLLFCALICLHSNVSPRSNAIEVAPCFWNQSSLQKWTGDYNKDMEREQEEEKEEKDIKLKEAQDYLYVLNTSIHLFYKEIEFESPQYFVYNSRILPSQYYSKLYHPPEV